METQERLLEFPSAALTIHLMRLAGTTTKAPTKRSVRVAGRSSPRPCNWSGRPVRSIPTTKNADDFLRRSSCTAITVPAAMVEFDIS